MPALGAGAAVVLGAAVLGAYATLDSSGAPAFDVAVYGATPAGIMAAVAAARMNRTVALFATSSHIGGMVSSGLSHTDIIRPSDIDNRLLVGGVAREFFELNTAWYGAAMASPGTELVWDVEPHVAGILFRRMLDAANVTVVLNAMVANVTVSRNRTIIDSIRDYSNREFAASMWVDASYEGDLLASAGVSFVLGRESADEFNESLAGFTGGSSPQFGRYVDPYDAGGELLPLVDSLPPELEVGDADGVVSSYNFRLCITNRPDNQVPFEPPARYNHTDWELVRRACGGPDTDHEVGELIHSNAQSYPGSRYYKSKYDLNGGGCGGVYSDFVGKMHGSLSAAEWAGANLSTRALMWQQHKDYVQGLLWFTLTEFGAHKGFGLCKDEFPDNEHWPPQLYVREARRMRGDSVVSQRDVVATQDIGTEAVGLGGYVFDTHTARRYACAPGSPADRMAQCTALGGGSVPPGTSAYAYDESHMVSDPGLFQLPRSLLLPKRAEMTNLVVPTAVSASHVTFSSMRMEPQWMVLGHAAGVLAALALGVPATGATGETVVAVAVQDVPATQLNEALRGQGAMLDLPVVPPQSSSCVLNRCVAHKSGAHDSRNVQCQFCRGLAQNEWLAPVSDFTMADRSSANVTALRATTLRKALVPDAATDLPVPAGYSCGRAYLQNFRGVWIIHLPTPPPPQPPPPAQGVWFAWVPMFNYNEHSLTITASQRSSLLKRVWSVPSGKLPAKSVCRVAEATVLKLVKPATTMGNGNNRYYEVELAARQACPMRENDVM